MPSHETVPAPADPQKFLDRIKGALAVGAESVEVYITAKKKVMLCIWWKK
jgi:hypothetical protein